MKDKTPTTIELAGPQAAFLDEMVRKYGLEDAGKAVRCLINFARETSERQDDIFTEVRCLDC